MRTERLTAWNLAGVLAAIAALVLLYPDFVLMLTDRPPRRDPGLPPAFSGNRAAYGFALFSMFTMTSLAIRKVLIIVCQLREDNWREEPDIGLYRIAIALMMTTVIIGVSPDVALLLLWGEISPDALTVGMTVDRICDGLSFGPFLAAIFVLLRAEQIETVPFHHLLEALERPEMTPRRRALYLIVPKREGIADHVRIIASVMVIALGLAVLK